MAKSRTTEAVRLLKLAGRFNRLAKSCPRRHRRSYRDLKHAAVEQAIVTGPGQFVVDSVSSGRRLTVGLTHLHSGRRAHVCPHDMSLAAQAHMFQLAQAAGMSCPFPRHSDEQCTPHLREKLKEISL